MNHNSSVIISNCFQFSTIEQAFQIEAKHPKLDRYFWDYVYEDLQGYKIMIEISMRRLLPSMRRGFVGYQIWGTFLWILLYSGYYKIGYLQLSVDVGRLHWLAENIKSYICHCSVIYLDIYD